MSINIQDYEQKLQGYTEQINTEKEKISSAERAVIVSQTQLTNYQQQMAALEQECQTLTGKPITDIETVLKDNMKQLDKLMGKVQTAKTVSDNLNVLHENELLESMQFTADEEEQGF